jgi:hypothetical protein
VRIGTPARKHGVGDADIWHAVRTAIRKIDIDDDLTMLILSGKGDVMKHTDAQIEDAARRFERLADNLDPASVAPEDLSDLRAVAEAAEQVRRDEALVTERVAAARARGRSWNRIAVALGVSRQAARHRFADKVG